MYITNTQDLPSYKISKSLGVVRGSCVRAKWFGADIISGLKNIVGGELTQYTNLMNEAREIAMQKMKDDAKKLDADAIVNIRFTTSQIAQNAAEILVYGTAVKIKKSR